MYRTHISETPYPAVEKYKDGIVAAGTSAFGNRSEEFAKHLLEKFLKPDVHQIIPYGQEIAGFALYYRLPDSGLYIDGIAINSKYQAKGLAKIALTEAIQYEGAKYVAGITRNPATLKLISDISSVACPDIRKSDNHESIDDPAVLRAIGNSAVRITPDLLEVFPYIENRYPLDMYQDDPGVNMPYDAISLHPRTAMAFVGII